MRAKTVPYKAVVFDFDETLVQTNAKIHVYKNNKKIKSLTSYEFNTYIAKSGETLDFSDFNDPLFVLSATKYKMWPALENIYFKTSNGQENTNIYILTARTSNIVGSIYTFLKRNNIIIPETNIIAVGGDSAIDIAKLKGKILKELKEKYMSILFYDDSVKNIKLASQLGINAILVDWNKNN